MASLATTLGSVAAFTSAFLAGGMNLVSMLTVPMILTTTPPDSSLLLRQWNFVYNSGHKLGPKLSVTGGLIYFAAAWASQERGRSVALYAISGVLTMSMIPFTWLFILRINSAIFLEIEKGRAGGSTNLAQAQYLVGRWRSLNIARTFFPLFGAALGLLTVCGVVR
ncbi:hypothetical protein P154DRAFT_491037 [Amniculicola lignicola CBS 123094]|uniref:DUF1772-domain-containing protein n=1 Tax=Amniculicola lignicola CBS 123094 TaxID=1392246 RepID=A0A6A5WIJ1_9PLEO|nr:hypothetical protein P154DRAFT_491037 [Amniculicola lignicola CBS 123094]